MTADRALAVFPAGISNGEFGLPDDEVVVMARGEGCRLWDSDGKEFLDFSMGWGSVLVGHARPEVVRAVRDAVGSDAAVLAKLNMSDGVKGGLWIDESLQVARWLEEDGALDALELSGGSSLQNPMYLFRGEAPIAEMAASMPKAIRRRTMARKPYRSPFASTSSSSHPLAGQARPWQR